MNTKRPYKIACMHCHEDFVIPRNGGIPLRCPACALKVSTMLRKKYGPSYKHSIYPISYFRKEQT